jgi:hypothetical protein
MDSSRETDSTNVGLLVLKKMKSAETMDLHANVIYVFRLFCLSQKGKSIDYGMGITKPFLQMYSFGVLQFTSPPRFKEPASDNELFNLL